MSADTSIWIAKFPRWWRTTGVVQCIDNIQWYKEKWTKKEYEECVEQFFLNEIYATKKEAFDKARSIERAFDEDDDWGIWLEYWIVDLWEI